MGGLNYENWGVNAAPMPKLSIAPGAKVHFSAVTCANTEGYVAAPRYSYRKARTGLALATRSACTNTVAQAITSAPPAAATKVQGARSTW